MTWNDNEMTTSYDPALTIGDGKGIGYANHLHQWTCTERNGAMAYTFRVSKYGCGCNSSEHATAPLGFASCCTFFADGLRHV